jgi:hypothetical protein
VKDVIPNAQVLGPSVRGRSPFSALPSMTYLQILPRRTSFEKA